MSLLFRLFQAVRGWRRRLSGPNPKTARRSGVRVEQLDHRQLLTGIFTGNVPTDFPATTSPGVVVLNDPNNVQPIISPTQLAQLVKVSGFDISGIRVNYSPTDDTLSIGLDQPPSQQSGQPGEVIAGDADNNGNDGMVSPAVTNLVGTSFMDFPVFGGSEYMGAFLDLKGSGYADVVAGYSVNDPRPTKQYQVAQAIVNTSGPPTTPFFGTELPQFEGTVFKQNSPATPNLEFSIAHFSQLYLQETGKTLTPNSSIAIGAMGGSGQDSGNGNTNGTGIAGGITEEFFHEQPFTLSQAIVPETANVLINPHSASLIDTVHDTLVRVNVLGSPTFDATQIEPQTVTLGSAHPVFSFNRLINNDNYLDASFVFQGPSIKLPTGRSVATVTGDLTTGGTFSGSHEVFNRDASFYSPSAVAGAKARQAARDALIQGGFEIPPAVFERAASRHVRIQIDDVAANSIAAASIAPASSSTQPSVPLTGPIVSIPQREPAPKLAGRSLSGSAPISAAIARSMSTRAAGSAQPGSRAQALQGAGGAF
jgi:hypothetical protein